MPRPVAILRTVMAAAIREQRVLSLVYARSIEPQLFAPVALYISAADQFFLAGYEVRRKTVRWRILELEQVRDVWQTPQSFSLDAEAPIPKTYPTGATVIAQASLPGF